jgi:uncharacterized coiled-coil protein SlyX
MTQNKNPNTDSYSDLARTEKHDFRAAKWWLLGGLALLLILNIILLRQICNDNWITRLLGYTKTCQSGITNLPNAGDNDKQQLSINGTSLSITGGGSVDLSFLTGTPGPAGANGSNGTIGSNGATGATGPAGSSGPTPPNCLPGEVLTYSGGSYSCVTPPGGTVLSAQNGTSLVGTAVELGLNPLLHDTTIPQGAFNLTLDGSGGGSFYQDSLNAGTGNHHGINSGDNILSAPFSGTVMYSSPNPSLITSGGEGAYFYTLDGQTGQGATDGINEQTNLFIQPTGLSLNHNGLAGNSGLNAGSTNINLFAQDNATNYFSSANLNNTPGLIEFYGQGAGTDSANINIDGANTYVQLYSQTSIGGQTRLTMNSGTNFSEWYTQDNVGGTTNTQHDTTNGRIYNFVSVPGSFNNFEQNAVSGLIFNSNVAPVSAPHMFAVSQLGDIDFDRELRPGGLAGSAGNVLISQGPGLAPIWGSGGITSINGQTGPAFSIAGGAPITVTTGVNTATIDLAPCAAAETYIYNGAAWVCTSAPLPYTFQNGLTESPAGTVELGGANALQHFTDIASGGFDLAFDSAGAGGRFSVGCVPAAGKVATFCGDVNITGVIDPTALLFSDTTGSSSYNPATNNGYRIGVTGATQRPIFISPLSDSTDIFQIRNSANVAFFSADSSNSRIGIGTSTPAQKLDINGDALINGIRTGLGTGAIATNTAFGFTTLNANTIGTQNTGIGYLALAANTSATRNTAIGWNALAAVDIGGSNTAVGGNALALATNGSQNTAVGRGALQAITSGGNNNGIGVLAMGQLQTGTNNIAIGNSAMYVANGGNQNVVIGVLASITQTTASTNTIIGYNTGGGLTTGGANTIIGANVNGLAAGTTNNVIISDGSGNRRILVDSAGNMGIANTTPGFRLHVGSAAIASGTTISRFQNAGGTCDVTPNVAGGITCTSDITLKKNIEDYQGGLDTILALNTIKYNMKAEDDGTTKQIGFSAQDLEKLLPGLVITDTDGHKSVSYAGLTPVLTSGLKELNTKLEFAVKEQNGKLEDINKQLADQGIQIVSISDQLKALSEKVDNIESNTIVNTSRIKELVDQAKKQADINQNLQDQINELKKSN